MLRWLRWAAWGSKTAGGCGGSGPPQGETYSRQAALTSVVIAAHNEEAVIDHCLKALLQDAHPGELDVTVVANGCSDATARRASAYPGVRVLELPAAGKASALNAGDEVAKGFPRVYLDADSSLSTAGVRLLSAALKQPVPGSESQVLAVAPRRTLDMAGRPLLVRAYTAISARLPAFEGALFGRGVVAISETGRRRFDRFPDLVADDLFLDSLFSVDEKRQVDAVESRVVPPRRTLDLVQRLARVRRGNAQLRAAAGFTATSRVIVRDADRLSWLRDVVWRRPWLGPAAVGYVGITVAAAAMARLSRRGPGDWWSDTSSRRSSARSNTGEGSA
jgi:glycosyltransferase involved in cell wall biosynthesis